MKYTVLLTKIMLICFFSFCNQHTSNGQHSIYTNFIVMGSDSLQPADEIQDTLFFFDTKKAGFMGGVLEGPFNDWEWQHDSIGIASLALGYNALVFGDYGSMALGRNVTATGDYGSLALGQETTARGNSSIAFGFRCSSGGSGSLIGGFETRSNGINSIAIGSWSQADGDQSIALGHFAVVSGNNGSMAVGSNVNTNGSNGASAIGQGLTANANSGTVVGQYNDPIVVPGYDQPDKPLFIVGNGFSNGIRTNALVVKQDGEVAFENYKFPKEDGDGGQILKSNGSGQLTWTDANITYQCPSGYEEVFNFCIEGDPNTAGKQNLQTAIETCALDGGQVPTYQQFYLAVDAGVLSTSSGENRRHWMEDLVYNSGIRGTTALEKTVGPQSISVTSQNAGSNFYFRCVINK